MKHSLIFSGLSAAAFLYSHSIMADFSPLQIRDQNPFNLIHGQPLPVDARIASEGKLLWNNNLTVTNTLNSETTGSDSLYLDYESYQLNLGLQYGLNDSWAIKVDIPLINKGGGFLDSAINSWHNFFNLPQADRPNVENNQYRIERINNTRTVNDLQTDSTGIGDLQLNLANTLYNSQSSTISLWMGLKLPTGDSKKLNSNDAIDASLSIAANHHLASNWYFNTNAGVVFPAIVITGDKTGNNTSLNNQVFFGHAMLAWQATEWMAIKIQANGHSSYYKNNSLRLLGSTYTGSLGASFYINQCNSIDVSFSEDIKVSASPDVSFTLGWRHVDGC